MARPPWWGAPMSERWREPARVRGGPPRREGHLRAIPSASRSRPFGTDRLNPSPRWPSRLPLPAPRRPPAPPRRPRRRRRARTRRSPSASRTRCARSYLDYAMSVIIGRAIPDVRDGLKPVHRRILYSAVRAGPRPHGGATARAPRIVGDVLGKYHPHGDARVYDAHGPPRAGLLDALPAHRRAGQLRLGRRRPRGRLPVHRGAPHPHRRRAARRHRQGERRLRAELRRLEQEPTRPAGAKSRTCSSTARAASPSAWRRTSRRTTWARSSTPPST